MQKANLSQPLTNADNAPQVEPLWLHPLVEKILGAVVANAPAPTPFTDFAGLVRHLPMYGERKTRDMLDKKIIPTIRPPGTRKLAFHLPSVDAALLRFSKGGIE